MYRRAFLKRMASVSGSTWLAAQAANVARDAISPVPRFKLGAISDGFSQNFEEALQIMKAYGLAWVEIREVFGIYNTEATAAQIRQIKDLTGKYEFRVSVIDSALYKCTLPGTMPTNREKDVYPYADQMDLLKRACDRAHALGAEKVRGFTFWRVAEPDKLSARIAGQLQKAAEVASGAGMRLVIENEETCNAATGHELSSFLTPSAASNLGANWDVGNGYMQGEVSYPDGYNALDKKRIWHMHIKGMACAAGLKNCAEALAGQGQNDLVGQFKRLLQDRYQETMSLECEFEVPGLTHLETTKRSLEGLLRVIATATESNT